VWNWQQNHSLKIIPIFKQQLRQRVIGLPGRNDSRAWPRAEDSADGPIFNCDRIQREELWQVPSIATGQREGTGTQHVRQLVQDAAFAVINA
jgi:NAD kinase